ncbi:hypothetical protein ACS0X5_06305 [Burkholderia gladioli]|uniref:hypothetical protein n=1 Tax=Burkholderia gladioli TaxID=28095 RepID=UPI003F7AEE5A
MSDKLSDCQAAVEILKAQQQHIAADRFMCDPECELPQWDALQRVIDMLGALAASPVPAIPAVDREAIIEQCAQVCEMERAAFRANEAVWDANPAMRPDDEYIADWESSACRGEEYAARIRALKAAPAISESEPVFKVGDHVCMKHPSIYPDFGVVEQITHPGGLQVRSGVTGRLVTFLTRDTELDRYAAIDAARKGEKS